jgi:hypothetical protein
MSTVNITQELKGRIHQFISDLSTKDAVDQGLKTKNVGVSGTSELLMRIGFGDHYDLSLQCPKHWFSDSDYTNLTVIVSTDEKGNNIEHEVHFENLKGYRMAPGLRWRNAGKCTLEYLKSNLHLAGAAEAVEAAETQEQIRLIRAKWEGVQIQIRDFLEKCRTLNEAVKLYPGLRMYVPKEYLDRLDKKVERAEKVAKLHGIDTEGLTAAAIAAKLAGLL